MSNPNHHIILRQIFELEFPPGVNGFSLQQEIGRIVREKLLPAIEALFDRFAAADELIRIDKLELDIGRVSPTDLETTLVNKILKQLEEQLEIAVINRPLGVERLPLVENHFEQWLFFLENGYRPQHMCLRLSSKLPFWSDSLPKRERWSTSNDCCKAIRWRSSAWFDNIPNLFWYT